MEGDRLTRADLLALFEKQPQPAVRAAIVAASRSLHVDADDLTLEDALRLLECMAGERGPIAVTARFAKARMLLRAASAATG